MRRVACEPFATIADLQALGCDTQDLAGGELWTQVLDAASDMMAVLSGGSVTGVCEGTITACRECFCCCGWCNRCHRDPLYLRGPVQTIEEVLVLGVPMASSEYRVERTRELIRLDSDGARICWPAGEVEVTYTWGHEIDEITRLATAELAVDIAKGLKTGQCSLPIKNLSNITMNGVSLSRREVADIVREAGTDLPRVAAWMSIFNPENQRGQTLVYSPETFGDWEYTT